MLLYNHALKGNNYSMIYTHWIKQVLVYLGE